MSDLAGDAERSRAAKIALRDQLLTKRRSLTPAAKIAAASSVQASTLARVRADRPTVCAAYVPVHHEPGGPDLPDVLAGVTRVLLPVLRPDRDLEWIEYDGTLRDGPHGLREPSGRSLGVAGIRAASLVIVPALAVSRAGVRLGRGGGSYDRALARLSPGVQVIGLLHDGELLDVVPAEPHDRPVDAVITPAEGHTHLLNPRPGWTK